MIPTPPNEVAGSAAAITAADLPAASTGRDGTPIASSAAAAAAVPLAHARPLGMLAAIAALFVGIYASTFWFMMKRWTSDPAATHGWLVLPIIAWVIWEKRDKLKTLPLSSHGGGLWVMAFALFLHLAEKAIDLNGPSPLSIPIFVGGAIWYLAGTQWLKEMAFPIGYLCFMIPIPGGLTEVVSFPLRILATNGSRAIVHLFGVEVYGSGMHMEFFQPRGLEYIRLEVADPCSGLHSLMAIKALHAITAYKTRLKLGWKWVLFMCAIPVSLAANLCRMVSIILVAAYINKDFGLGLWHEGIAPYLLFGFAFIILISLGRFMEWATGATRREKKDPPTPPVTAVTPAEGATA
jgi:exosortase